MDNAVSVDVKKADFISMQALRDYAAHNQDESFLGVDADTILYYEAHVSDTQYYVIHGNGEIEILELPPDPVKEASIFERIMIGIAAIGVAVAGIVLSVVSGGVGSIVGGAMISAALDVFCQVTVNGTAPENINWKSVLVSGTIGAVTGALSLGAGAVAAKATAKIASSVGKFLVEGGIQILSGAISGAVTSIGTTLLLEHRMPTFSECMKAVGMGMVTAALLFCAQKTVGAIANKVQAVKNSKAVVAQELKDATYGTNKPLQKHHYLTDKNKKFTPKFKQITDKYDLDLNSDWNIELLPHQGRHPNAYHQYMLDSLSAIDNQAKGNVNIFLEKFTELKQVIRNNPDMLYKAFWKNLFK